MRNESLLSFVNNWEFFKYKVRQIAIKHSKLTAMKNKGKEFDLIKEINTICCKTLLSDIDKQKLIALQAALDNIYMFKAKGAFLRSRAKWIEEGEKSTAYFCRLEKRRQEKNALKSLIIGGQISKDPDLISKEVYSFYSKLYSSSYSSNGYPRLMKISMLLVRLT